jgi:predicted O-methyltransferase YrrM
MAHAFMNVYDFKQRACIIRDLSVEAAKLFPDETLDFVYIDAGHDKKSVNEDLNAWYPKVRTGGLIIGDDYFDGLFHLEGLPNSTTLVEVKSAVDDFAKKIGKEINSLDTSDSSLSGNKTTVKQWWICK